MMENKKEKLKNALSTIHLLRASVLEMCDQMDSSSLLEEKEKIRLAIISTENLLGGAIDAYNEMISDIK